MSPTKLRLLAECLERDFITAEDRKGWVSDLRGMAKSMERAAEDTKRPVEPAPFMLLEYGKDTYSFSSRQVIERGVCELRQLGWKPVSVSVRASGYLPDKYIVLLERMFMGSSNISPFFFDHLALRMDTEKKNATASLHK